MGILDCESTVSTLESLAEILGVDRAYLADFVRRFDLATAPHDQESDEVLFSALCKRVAVKTAHDATCAFHVTRTDKPASFSQEGLLPLPKAIPKIWGFLSELGKVVVSDEEWKEFRRGVETANPCHYACLYRMKVGERGHWGPWGFLIRDFALVKPGPGYHDYRRTPEVVEDICICFQEHFGHDLLSMFIERTVPCVVKFRTSEANRVYLSAALHYLYVMHHEEGPSAALDVGVSAGPDGVPPKHILAVEQLDSSLSNEV